MADEKEKKTTTAKAPAKTVRRVRKTAQKAETVQKKPEVQKEERRMSQEALGMVETRGLTAAIEAADIVLMDDDPLKISKAIHISRKCIHIVYENIYFAIGIKILCLILGALGIANMWVAIFADVGVMVLAVLNATRCLVYKD